MPLIILTDFCKFAAERLKGKYEGLLKYICTPSRYEGQKFLFGQGRIMEDIR